MILQALHHYFGSLVKAGLVTPPGVKFRPIYWGIVIDKDGNFLRIEDKRNGKSALSFRAPAPQKRSGQKPPAQYLVDNRKYVLGYGTDGNFDDFRFSDYKEKIAELSSIFPDNEGLRAILSFYEHYTGDDTPLPGAEDIQNSEDITFFLGSDTAPICSSPDILIWAQNQIGLSNTGGTGLCIVTGKRNVPLQNIHSKVNVPGAQASATLVSFQKSSGYDSYGKEQGANAPISKEASFTHTTALNFLLKNDHTHTWLGDIQYVFWNSDASNNEPEDLVGEIAFGTAAIDDDEEEDEWVPKKKKKSSEKDKADVLAHQHEVINTFKAYIGTKDAFPERDSTHRFYILGLKGEQGRIAVRQWKEGSIREIFENLYMHLQDFNIENYQGTCNEEYPPIRNLYSILRSTFPSGAKNIKISPHLVQSFLESIINGTMYPLSLQQAVIARLGHGGKVTELRASVLKAAINRKIRLHHCNYKELTMSLDKENTNVAYLCGRLLAVLEKIQKDSLGSSVNSTVVDRFYGSASTRPNSAFGRIIALSQHHLSKLKKDPQKKSWAISNEKRLSEIMDMIDVNKDPEQTTAFPSVFSLDQQCLFAVGFYHQRTDFYKKKEDSSDNDNN